jgi:hypothetical protein
MAASGLTTENSDVKLAKRSPPQVKKCDAVPSVTVSGIHSNIALKIKMIYPFAYQKFFLIFREDEIIVTFTHPNLRTT